MSFVFAAYNHLMIFPHFVTYMKLPQTLPNALKLLLHYPVMQPTQHPISRDANQVDHFEHIKEHNQATF